MAQLVCQAQLLRVAIFKERRRGWKKILYCPTSCPYLGKNGCKVACGNEEIECPVMTGVLALRKDARSKRTKNGEENHAGIR